MLTSQVRFILSRIKLAPWYRNVRWNVEGLVCRTEYEVNPSPTARFRIEYAEPDVGTGIMEWQVARWWYIEKDSTFDAVIKTAWLALIVSDEHRRREGFYVSGVQLFNPHAPLNWPKEQK